MAMTGASSTRAPAASSNCVKRWAWAAARVTTTVRPSSGLSCVGCRRAILAPHRLQIRDARRALVQQRFSEPAAERLGIRGRRGRARAQDAAAVLADDD